MKTITQMVQNLLKPYIDRKDLACANTIAPVETTSTTTMYHSTGEYLIYNGQLYKATKNIGINRELITYESGSTNYNIKLVNNVAYVLNGLSSHSIFYDMTINTDYVSEDDNSCDVLCCGSLEVLRIDIFINNTVTHIPAGTTLFTFDNSRFGGKLSLDGSSSAIGLDTQGNVAHLGLRTEFNTNNISVEVIKDYDLENDGDNAELQATFVFMIS